MALIKIATENIFRMKTDHKNRRKQLLKDPLTAFKTEYGNADIQKIELLNNLWADYLACKTTLNDSQQQQRQISREFGIAKHNGTSVESFKQKMQECSSQAKYLADKLQETEEQILTYFDNHNPENSNKTPAFPEFGKRLYPNPPTLKHQNVTISTLGSEVDEWNTYAAQNPAASLYHRAEWRDLIEKTFGHSSFYFVARNPHGKVTGILPLIRLKSLTFGDFLISMPYFNYGGAMADNVEIEQQLMDAANKKAESLGVQHIEYRDDIKRNGYPVRTDKVNMILALPKDEKSLWVNFSAKLRAQIRRPQREEAKIQYGGIELLKDFYIVFSRNMRDLGTPVYSMLFFENILKTFSQQSSIIVVRLNNRPVCAAFLIGQGSTLEIPWASTLREVNHLSMNMLMYWEVLRFAIKEGYQYFDFGRSSLDSGTYRFKQQWGAIPKPLYWHYWLSGGNDMPALNPSNPKYALMINIWQRLPVFVTRWLGPKIVKNIP